MGSSEYNFAYDDANQFRSESADASGNVRGSYSYQDDAGKHELTYTSGADGFKVTGGNLAKPYSFLGQTPGYRSQWMNTERNSMESAMVKTTLPAADGSYGFDYAAGDHSRKEYTDSDGNVVGSYSFIDAQGRHEISYKAGAGIGYVITGEKLFPDGSFNRGSFSEATQGASKLSEASQLNSAALNLNEAQGNKIIRERYPALFTPKLEATQGSTQTNSGTGLFTSKLETSSSQSNFGGASKFNDPQGTKIIKERYPALFTPSPTPAPVIESPKIFNVSFKQGTLTQWQPTAGNPKFGYVYEAKY